jgi:hypothetical protein
MKAFAKSAIVLSIAGVMALGSLTASEARGRAWVAGAAGFAAGAAVGVAAANSYSYGNGYYDNGYYAGGPAYYAGDRPGGAYTGDPAYQGYNAYGYAPGYSSYGYDGSTQSYPAHRDPNYGYNSNTLSPWQERKLQGNDY